jgi:hypothetical protein
MMGHGTAFHNGGPCAAWLGLGPRPYAHRGPQRLGYLSTRGAGSLRLLLRQGACRVLRLTGQRPDAQSRAAERLKPRRGEHGAAVARAAQPARRRWVLRARAHEDRRVACGEARRHAAQGDPPQQMAGMMSGMAYRSERRGQHLLTTPVRGDR